MISIALRIAEQSPWGGLYVYVTTRQGRNRLPRSRGRAHSTVAAAAWPRDGTRQRARVPAQAQVLCAAVLEQELDSASLARDAREMLSRVPFLDGFLDGKIATLDSASWLARQGDLCRRGIQRRCISWPRTPKPVQDHVQLSPQQLDRHAT